MNKSSTPVISVAITGGPKTVKAMDGLKKSVSEAIFVRAIKPSLAEMMAAAKANIMGVSSKSGGSTKTRDAIASRISIKLQRAKGSRYYSKGRLAVFYGKPRSEAPRATKGSKTPLWVRASLAHLIEYGYKLTYYFGRKIKPRRIAERPFMRPAFNKHKSRAEARFLAIVREETKKASK